MGHVLEKTLPDGLSAVGVRTSDGVVAIVRPGLSDAERARVIHRLAAFEADGAAAIAIPDEHTPTVEAWPP